MRIIAVIDDPSKVKDDPRVREKFLGYLGACHDPPQKSPAGSSSLYYPEPHRDVDRMPEYEHILTV